MTVSFSSPGNNRCCRQSFCWSHVSAPFLTSALYEIQPQANLNQPFFFFSNMTHCKDTCGPIFFWGGGRHRQLLIKMCWLIAAGLASLTRPLSFWHFTLQLRRDSKKERTGESTFLKGWGEYRWHTLPGRAVFIHARAHCMYTHSHNTEIPPGAGSSPDSLTVCFSQQSV